MGRTASSARTPRHAPKNGLQDNVLAIIWSCLMELWLIGSRYDRLLTASRTLDRQLAEPNAPQREGYREACARYAHWTAELQGHDMKLPTLLSNLAKHYGKLSQRNRLALIANDGWSQSANPDRFAADMWERARRREKYPRGEPHFDQTALEVYLEERMTQERQQIADDVEQRVRAMHVQEVEAAA